MLGGQTFVALRPIKQLFCAWMRQPDLLSLAQTAGQESAAKEELG